MSYPLNQSPLYRLNSKRKLADLLQLSLRDLTFLASLADGNYQVWELTQKLRDQIAGFPAGKPRSIQRPLPLLREVHERLANLLAKIDRPDFVYSAIKGRSYLDNALQHANAHPAFKVDIKNFYPSITIRWVKRFFEKDLECVSDVAHFLAKLCCVGNALPTGSAISPVLSYFSCAPVFGVMEKLAQDNGLKFTLYVDDMFFSGPKAGRNLSKQVLSHLARNGFRGHKVSHFAAGQVKVITGVAIAGDSISIPFKRQKRIRLFEEAFAEATLPDHCQLLGRTLLGQYREGERLQKGSRDRAKPILERLHALGVALFDDLTQVKPKRRRSRRKQNKRQTAERVARLRQGVQKLAVPASGGT